MSDPGPEVGRGAEPRDPAPYHHILVGTDGSVSAQLAVSHAAELAVACGARLTVVSAYVRHDAGQGLGAPDEARMASDLAGAEQCVAAAQALARQAGVRAIGGRTEAGDPAAVLLDVAAEVGADLVVVGSRGMATPSRFVLGSVPNRVSHHAGCDVVIVRTTD